MPNKTKNTNRADQYDDPAYNYVHYWEGREYENAAEEMAIRRLLKGKSFKHAIDIGGGYGRLSKVLSEYAKKVSLLEPSSQQLSLAKDYLKELPKVERLKMQADKLGFADGTIDLAVMVRVMHHLPDPTPAFKELARVLSKDGTVVLEAANYTHFRNRIKQILKFKKFSSEPVDIRSAKNKKEGMIAFVNHNPKTVIKQLSHEGLKVERVLSVSNLRSPGLKKVVPRSVMLKFEKIMQPTLAKSYFGPSIFFLIKKAS